MYYSDMRNNPKGAKMELKLMQLRKAAGYKNRDDFAAVLGVNPRTYKTWETGARNMSFPQACMVADALHCSLDELAGRVEFVGSFSDQRQAVMNEDYAHLSDAGKDAAAGAVRGIRASEGARVQTAGLEDHQIAASA
ncbi:helix-turn-helix transcriptional regulator [Adlercreutzia sp.]|uniref:helix-turn-helix transcriptional regulator n=1 Tax=Adlercreutzia sp. TaxID=1872387 RepID=UPI003AB142A3